MRLFRALAPLAVFFSLVAIACGGDDGPKLDTRSAAQIVADLRARGLPIAGTMDFTEENDPEKLLGRPGQYISRTNFHDSRLFTIEALVIPVASGGAVEVFRSVEDATRRREYLEALGRTVSLLNEYDYQKANVVLRLSRALTPQQAQAYADAFMASE